MRSLFVALIIFGWLPFMIFKPYVGVLIWTWLSHMYPQVAAGGFAATFPFLDLVAGLTLVGLLLDKAPKKLPGHPIVILLAVYFLWVIVTTLLAFDTAGAIEKLVHSFKVYLFVYISIIIMQSPNRLKFFLWILIMSMAYISVKGGLFTILTGGGGRVQGAGGMMEDNNQLAIAMAMSLPIAIYFYHHPPMKILKWPAAVLALLFVVTVIGTQSRGGFAALAGVLFMLLLKSKRKFALIAVMIPLVIGGVFLAPESWKNRIASSEDTTEDSSFRGRVVMWQFSSNLADDNPIEGGGFDVFYVQRARELYLTPGEKGRAPHSIYFEVLGEHGYTGLTLFLTLLFTGWYSGGSAAKRYRAYEETRWLGDLCGACQLSIVGYAVGGLTVNIATFDYFYDLLALIVLSTVVGEKLLTGNLTPYKATGLAAQAQETSKKWKPPRPASHPAE